VTTWLTVRDAAKYIGAKSTDVLRAAIRAGELPAYTYGKNEIRLKAADLDAWLESKPYEPRRALVTERDGDV